jgi:integrase
MARRSYGSGSLFVKTDAAGVEHWYGQWRAGGRLVKRRLGLKRPAGSRDGLTKIQAERELQASMLNTVAASGQRVTVADAGGALLAHLAAMGRKPSTLGEYESMFRVHLLPTLGSRPIDALRVEDLERYITGRLALGKAPKSIRNQLGLLHSICAYAQRRGWATDNPCARVEKPRDVDRDGEIRFLDEAEAQALLAEVRDDALGTVERPLYLTAMMTGLRQGELLALRWRDVDWSAGRMRVRRSYVRGEFGSPKSKRSSRAVPLADAVARALEHHFQRSVYQADEDLVFAHPALGTPLDRSKVLKRFKATAARAGLEHVRFHDLRHTFGTRMAAAGVPMRTLQEWMGHRDFKTTLIYADYAPGEHERELIERAFRQGINSGINLSETERDQRHGKPANTRSRNPANP